MYSVEQLIEDSDVCVQAKCVSQVSDHVYVTYDVHLLTWSLHAKQELRIKDGRCTCNAGIAAQCKHAAAVCFYINRYEDTSCTSQLQQWGKPSMKPHRPRNQDLMAFFPSQESNSTNTKAASPSILLNYTDIISSMKEILSMGQMNAEKLVCQDVLNKIVDQASKVADEEIWEGPLKLTTWRAVYHCLKVVNNSATKKKIMCRDLAIEMNSLEAARYHTDVVLSCSPCKLSVLTQGQAKSPRWLQNADIGLAAPKHIVYAPKVVKMATRKLLSN
ncbi:uncharacterized protein LOC144114285 [Amblyomma americanum]